MEFEPVIGLEVHAQLKTKTKIFCNCSTLFGAPPNTHTCPVCLGLPGVLPVLNKIVVEYAICLAIATNCRISEKNRFARKNYFYPDLPKGYQVSQYELPIAEFGYIDIEVDGRTKKIGLTRIHMEEDAGKLSHDSIQPLSLVDFNRTGVPLLEIVSEPDLSSPAEAGAYLRKLHSLVRYLDICDGNMEEGSFRCDANVSIRPRGEEALGIRAELKNLNSFKHVEQAIKYEINRQKLICEDGGEVVQETRLWDPEKGKSDSMRSKEEAHDYRYFPDPDLVPIEIDEAWINKIKQDQPELPDDKKKRFVDKHKLPDADAELLTSSRALAEFFEECLTVFYQPKKIGNWIMGPLLGILNTQEKEIGQSPVSAKNLADLVKLIEDGVISGKIAKAVFEKMAQTGGSPGEIVEKKGLVQVTDISAIETVISGILENAPNEVAAYKNGKTKLMGFFVGRVMKETKGKANPTIVNQILKEKLEKYS